MRRAYIDTPQGQIHYRTEGNGEPVLLLHNGGLTSDEYTEMLPFIGRSYQAIAMDILGYGNSDMPSREPQLTEYVQNIIYFLDALKIKQTTIVGHLLGASFAVEIAAVYPRRVNNLVLWDCVYLEPEIQKQVQDEYRKAHMEFKEDGSHLIDLWKSHKPKSSVNLGMVQRSVVECLKSGLGQSDGVSHRALFAYDVEPKLSKIQSQTLLLYSRQSPLFHRLEAVRRLIPMCQTRTIEDAGSFPFWEKPEELSQLIMDFLQSKKI